MASADSCFQPFGPLANLVTSATEEDQTRREQPRLYFMHFWANDDAIKLAKGLRAALDNMANAESVGRSQETICEL